MAWLMVWFGDFGMQTKVSSCFFHLVTPGRPLPFGSETVYVPGNSTPKPLKITKKTWKHGKAQHTQALRGVFFRIGKFHLTMWPSKCVMVHVSRFKNLKLCIFRIIIIIIPKNHRQPAQKKSVHTLHPTHAIHIFTSCIYFYHHCVKKNVHLITSWWLNQPNWKIWSSKWVHLLQGSGWTFKKIFELPPPRKISQFYIYHLYKLPLGWLYITYPTYSGNPINNHWPIHSLKPSH